MFLRGLGGAAVAAPFLSSLAERAARGQGITSAAPKRLIVMFTHYGCLTHRWFPAKSHGALRAEDFAGTSLEVLGPHADKLLMPRGIRAMNEWTPDLSLGQGNDPHVQVLGSYFTCVPVTPHSSNPFEFDQAVKFNAMPTAPSLDHVCAQQLSADGLPLYMRVSGQTENPQSAVSYSAGEQAFPGVGSPLQAFSTLTGLFAAGSAASPDSYQVQRRKSVIDLVRGDLETLERFDMSGSDRRKLEAWKELLHETGVAVASLQCGAELPATLGLTDEHLAAYGEADGDPMTTEIADGLDGADLFSNIAVLAALCDQNRVSVLKYPGNHVYSGLGLTADTSSLAHRTGSANLDGKCLEGVGDLIQTIDRYYADKFAHLIGQLDAIEEDDGTLLDNTAAVWFQEFSDGYAGNLNNIPIIQAGGCGGYFKTGQAINVEDGSSDLSRGNSDGACDAAGLVADIKLAGTPREIGNAPINKYYCNLMNAIGVKAGEDGFPKVGGTGEVTHYGMYDDTRDFISGGENPPKINDPGEFEQLRAGS